jgi:uncharacterized damage-inducible protein DinB
VQPRTREVLDFLDEQRATLERAVAAVPPAMRDRRLAPDRWSVAEVLEHLALVEGRIMGMLDAQLAAARANGLGTERGTTPVVPTLDVAGLLDRSRKLTASEVSQPRGALGADDAWAALAARRAATRAAILAADGLALSEVKSTHPRIGTLDLYQWLVFLGGHEARHAAQVREIADARGVS